MERPILFSGPMVRAVREGGKTQARRVCKASRAMLSDKAGNFSRHWCVGPGDTPLSFAWGEHERPKPELVARHCPYGSPGDRLWVRETWAENEGTSGGVIYRADIGDYASSHHKVNLKSGEIEEQVSRWRPSIHMPKWASRITLEVTGIRVERLQEISGKDVIAEGVVEPPKRTSEVGVYVSALALWVSAWDSLNAKRGHSWESNPWVWVVEFRKLNKEEE